MLKEDLVRSLEVQGFRTPVVSDYKKIYHVNSGNSNYSLKELKYPEEEFAFIYQATEYAYQNGFPYLSRNLLLDDGYPFLVVDDKKYTMTQWIKGTEADYTKNGDVAIAALALADLHLAARGFTAPFFKGRIKWGELSDNFTAKILDLQKFKEQCGQRRVKTGFDRLFIGQVDYYLEQAEATVVQLEQVYSQVNGREENIGGFCHHDFASHNIIIDNKGLGHIIDFDYCIADLRYHDVASFIYRVLRSNDWQSSKAIRGFQVYNGIYPCSPQSLKVIMAYLRFPQDFWQAALAYYVERRQGEERLYHRLRYWLHDESWRQKAFQEVEQCLLGKKSQGW